jgi:hypothetical protein
VPAPVLDIPGANHWSIVDDLASPGHALHRLALTLMRVSGGGGGGGGGTAL